MRTTAIVAVLCASLWLGHTALAEDDEVKLDPFAHLVKQLEPRLETWTNGIYPNLGLPTKASAPAVVARLFEVISFTDGIVTEHKVVETRPLVISSERYTAALCETNLGRKIVLMRLDSQKNWWTRVFDVEE
jgi:hypothetical protein